MRKNQKELGVERRRDNEELQGGKGEVVQVCGGHGPGSPPIPEGPCSISKTRPQILQPGTGTDALLISPQSIRE